MIATHCQKCGPPLTIGTIRGSDDLLALACHPCQLVWNLARILSAAEYEVEYEACTACGVPLD